MALLLARLRHGRRSRCRTPPPSSWTSTLRLLLVLPLGLLLVLSVLPVLHQLSPHLRMLLVLLLPLARMRMSALCCWRNTLTGTIRTPSDVSS